MSPDIQNQLLDAMDRKVLRSVVKTAREAEYFFAVILDEMTEI